MLSNGHIKSELSPQDQELISLLQWAPRITWGEAAEILGAHATTLAGRWEKLERSGIAWITAQVNLSDTRNQLSFIEISCDPGGWAHVVDTFTAMPEVISVEAFAPSPDLGLTVLSHDLESLSRFVEEQISQVPGVAKVQLMLSSRLHRAGDKWRLDRLSDEQRAAAQAWTSAEQAALPTSTTALGEDQRPVIEALMRDGRASAAEIARSTGLHPADAERLLRVLHGLARDGATVVMAEHRPEAIRTADHVIDLGPGAGRRGGAVVAAGTPEQVAADPDSVTGPWLRG